MRLKFGEILKQKGLAFVLMGLLVAEAPLLGKKEDKSASSALTHYIMASLYSRQGKADEAIEEYKKAISLDSESATMHTRLAVEYIKKTDSLDKAVEELKESVKLDPEAADSHLFLALIYASKGQDELSNQEYEKALTIAQKKDPQNIDIYKGLGEVYLSQKKINDAIGVYKAILNISSQDAEAHYYLGSIYSDQNKNKEAIVEFKAAIKIKPDYADALNSLAYVYSEEGINLGEAEVLIKKALEIDQNNAYYVDTLGWIYFKKRKIDDAIKQLEKALALTSDPVIADHLGDAYFKKGKLNQAKEKWEESLRLNPDQEAVKNKIEKHFRKK